MKPPHPSRPIDAYKAIIDQLVDQTRLAGPGSHVATKRIYSKAPSHGAFNQFIASLLPEQRETLARMLQDARDGAIHDVLAMLSWWVDTRGLAFTFRGEVMPVDLSGGGLHGDYVGRRDGWDWPTDRTPTGEA